MRIGRTVRCLLRWMGILRGRRPLPCRTDRVLTPLCVTGLIATQFPQLKSPKTMRCGEGWDHEAYDADDRWIFRFPKRADVERRLMAELSILPDLKQHLPLPIPDYRFIGAPCEAFPYIFAGYEKIRGVRAADVVLTDASRAGLAQALGQFLSQLHAFPADAALKAGVPSAGWYVSEAACHKGARKLLRAASKAIPRAIARRCARFLDDPRAVPGGNGNRAVLVHQDLSPDHILLNPDDLSVAGIIDWTSAAVTDPAADFPWLWMWLGDSFVREVLAHYGGETDDAFVSRVRFRGICMAIVEVANGIETDNHAKIDMGDGALRRAFGER